MFEQLYKNITGKVEMSDEEFDVVQKLFIAKKLRRKQYLLQEGDDCKMIAFVNKGCLRSFSTDEKGQEHIQQFAVEDWWISDLASFNMHIPAVVSIDALEDSELLMLSREHNELLLHKVPAYERFRRMQMQNSLMASQKRMSMLASLPADKKYEQFVQNNPKLAQRVPQNMIASYLGMTPETLSRIRKQASGLKG